MTISVCMATYNGARFIKEQIESILTQLSDDDEVIVIDDCSSDNTIEIIKGLGDNRISIYSNNTNRGHVFSFGRAISLSNKEIIFMSDQDDIWIKGRVALMLEAFKTDDKVLLVSSNSEFIDTNGNLINHFNVDGVLKVSSKKYAKNIFDIILGKTNYFGCAMAFRKELKSYILPVPSYVESHDLWIALAANLYRRNEHIDEPTLQRRIHGSNASVISRPFKVKLIARWIFVRSIITLLLRYKR